MLRCSLGVAVAITLAAGAVSGEKQSGSANDEHAIRGLVSQLAAGASGPDLRTPDSIFLSGALRRPFVRGQGKPEPTTRAQSIVVGSDRVTTQVRRIEVAAGRDMAYEFSDGTIARRVKQPDGTEEAVTIENSTLRVWRKVEGRWLVAAHFSAPHGDRQ